MTTLNNLLKILFKYSTENETDFYNSEVFSCLKEISNLLKKEKIYNIIQYFTSPSGLIIGANLFAYNPKSKCPTILFQGHLDTVPTDDLAKNEITSYCVRGRGAVDMKGPLSGMLKAFIYSYNKNTYYTPALLITTDEEKGGFLGITSFFKKNKAFLKKIAFVINGEPTNFDVVTKFRGVLSYRIKKIGKRSHSAYPKNHLIEDMLPTINSIKYFLDASKKIKNKKFGKTIGAFSVINSGEKSNVMPKKFEASFNLRTVKKFEIYNSIFNKLFSNLPNKKIKVNTFHYDPTEAYLETKFKKAIKVALENNKIKYKENTAVFFTEANIFNNQGISAISIGPGNPMLAHGDSKKEILCMRDLKKYCSFLISLLDELNKS